MTVAAPPRPQSEASLPSTPYKGLTHYTEGDAPFFFGREDDTEIIVANLLASRLTVLYGDSGVGKSSLLRAGVARHLKDVALENIARGRPPRLVPVVFPEDDPEQEKRLSSWDDDPVPSLAKAIERAVAGLGLEVEAPPADQSLADLLAAWTELLGSDLLLMLDQFEEYLLYHENDGAEGTLGRELPEALTRRGLRASFLISIREDALARLDRFKTSIPNLLDNLRRVEHLDRESAEEAIRKPLVRWHELGENAVVPEDDLVDEVLKDVPTGVQLGAGGTGAVSSENDDAIETPFLQLVMERLWEADGASGKLTLATYERLGRAEDIVRTHLDGKMADLPEDDRRVAAKIFRNLVTPSGQKVAWTASDLAKREKLPEEKVEQVLDGLRDGRIVRPVAPPPNRPHDSRYEIFHDKLADAILAWSTAFNQKEERAAANKRVLFLRGVVLVLSGLVVAAVFFWYQARQHQKTAKSDELASKAVSFLSVDPNHALEEALGALDKKRTSAAFDALRQAIDAAHERVVFTMPQRQAVRHVAWSSDGSRIALVAGRHVYVWRVRASDARVEGGARILTPPRGRASGGLSSLSLSHPDGRFAVSASADGVFVWNTRSGRLVGRLSRWDDAQFDPANSHILAVTDFREARLVDWTTKRTWPLARSSDAFPYSVSFAANGKRLVAAGYGSRSRGAVFVWAVGGCARRATAASCPLLAAGQTAQLVNDAQLSSDGKRVIVSTGDGEEGWVYAVGSPRRLKSGVRRGARFYLGAATKLRLTGVVSGDAGFGTNAIFSPDDSVVATGSLDGTPRIWDWQTGRLVLALPGHAASVSEVAFDPTGRFLFSGGFGGTARIWSLDAGQELVDRRRPTAHRTPGLHGEFAGDGRHLLTLSKDGTIRIWTRQGRLVERLELDHADGAGFLPRHADEIYMVDARARGRNNSGLLLWNWLRGRRPTPISVPRQYLGGSKIFRAAISPDGTHAVVASFLHVLLLRLGPTPGTAKVAAVLAKSKPSGTLRARYWAAAYSPDGRYVAVAGRPHTAWVWDVSSCPKPPDVCVPRVLGGPGGHTDVVNAIAFSPDGKRIATAGDFTVRVWDWRKKGRRPLVVTGSNGYVYSVAFRPDGKEIAAGGADGTTRVWRIQKHGVTLLAQIRVHGAAINSVAFSPKSSILFTTSADGTARLYRCGTCTSSAHKVEALAKSKIAREIKVRSPPRASG